MRVLRFSYLQRDVAIHVEPRPDPGSLLRDLLGKLGVTLLVGPNGSGKTSLLSSLVRLIHHADWHHERCPTSAGLQYTLPTQKHPISLTRSEDGVGIAVRDSAPITVADASLRRNPREDEKLKDFIPKVVCSVFSTRGEYPQTKKPGYRGLRQVQVYDIAKLYGSNHYDVGSLSVGLRLLVSPEFADARQVLASIVGLMVTNEVRIHPTPEALHSLVQYTGEYPDPTTAEGAALLQDFYPFFRTGWMEATEEVRRSEAEGSFYINDVRLEGDQGARSLMELSAGQKMLLVRLVSVLSSISDGSLVLLEEPELHLDARWCGGLLELMGAFFGSYDAHLFVTTQSPSVVRCFPSHTIVELGRNGRPRQSSGNLFLAGESLVADAIYRDESLSTLDEHVLRKLLNLQPSERTAAVRRLGEGPVRYLAYLDAEPDESEQQ